MNPGDARWSEYSTAIIDNPETMLSPGFAYARRPIDIGTPGNNGEFWNALRGELAQFRRDGLHVTILGPLLTPSVGLAPTADSSSFSNRGLAARPAASHVPPWSSTAPTRATGS